MVGSNILSALKKKARRYSFGERSPHRLYKGKLDVTPSPGASPSKSQTSLANSSVVSTPRQIAIQPHVDATSIDKPVPQLTRRQTEATDPLDLAKAEVLTHTPEDSLIPTRLADEREDAEASTLTHENSGVGGLTSTATSTFSDTEDSSCNRERERNKQAEATVSSTNTATTLSSTAVAAAHEASKKAGAVGFVSEPDVIGWSESTTKMAGDAEALLEMELQALTDRYEVLKKKAEEREQMMDTTPKSSGTKHRSKSKSKSKSIERGRHRVKTKQEKERMKEYQLKSIEHGKKLLSVKKQTQPHLFESDEKKKTAEKNRQRWQRAKLAARSMTPLQDQRGTKTNQMLRRLSMILRSNAKESIYLNSPLDEKKGSPSISNISGVSEISLSLDDLMGGSSVSKPFEKRHLSYSPASNQGQALVMDAGSVAKTAAVEVSLASMMAEAEALAKEVKLVAQGEQWTPNVESLTTPPNDFAGHMAGKPVGRNLMNEFGNRTGGKGKSNRKSTPPAARAAEAPVSYSTSKANSNGPQHSIVIPRHQRNLSAPTIFSGLDASKEGASPSSDAFPDENQNRERDQGRDGDGDGDGDGGDIVERSASETTTPIQLSSSSALEDTTSSHVNSHAGSGMTDSAARKNSITSTPVSSVKQVEEESPVTGLVVEPSEEESFSATVVASKSTTPLAPDHQAQVHSSAEVASGGGRKDLVSMETPPKSGGRKASPPPDSPAVDRKGRAKGLRACLPCLFR